MRPHFQSCFFPSFKIRNIPNIAAAAVFVSVTALSGMVAGYATPAGATGVGPSGLPLPRYVSLKSSRVNMRVGPGREYKVQWMYTKRGLPLEILQEYDNWRKVRDPEGDEGWILQSLLSGNRTVIVSPWAKGEANSDVFMRSDPSENAAVRARMEPGAMAEVSECINGWCRLKAQGVSGYVRQQTLWGVYPDESFD